MKQQSIKPITPAGAAPVPAPTTACGTFTSVNFSWRYAFHRADNGSVFFDPQPAHDRWLAHAGAEKFCLLTSEQVVGLLNEALTGQRIVQAYNLQTKQLLTFTPSAQ